ncbi:FAD:protein FMN transferase [soil metagenome]
MQASNHALWQRRARPLLGTLVDIGVSANWNPLAHEIAFASIARVQSDLSRFEPASDVSRFNALPAGGRILLSASGRDVLAAADELRALTDGLFDITLGTAPGGWHIDGAHLIKLADEARIDLGGIAKGYAVDRAAESLMTCGCPAGWINAGGDLRAFGGAELALMLRDEAHGGVREFATLCDGAFATSHFSIGRTTLRSRSPLHRAPGNRTPMAHASVAASLCLWADALTKIVAASGDTSHPALGRYDAQAWLHG